MSVDTITISIDNIKYDVDSGSMLIDVADQVGIHIPRFCYHKKLSVAANCRMCLVEVEKAPKPMPACATPVTDGMKVWTRSEKALSAQKDTMEFLLINHPLDCPICDQGGECELQDLSMAAGGSSSSYQEIKRVVVDKDIGELVSTEMTRCIQCTRCVRFGEEIAGIRELGATGRGDRMEIGTFVEKSLKSELSGNIIDICPVGALTAKPSRYTARSWEMVQTSGIASHDCVGSSINLHSFKNKLVRVVAGENESINECWISDRDRFSYEGVRSEDRVKSPMLKQNGLWKNVSWSEALEAVAENIKSFDAKEVGVLASPRATTEELYLLQKAMRAIGVNNIDHRLRQTDFNDENDFSLYPWLGMAIAELEGQNAFLLVGANVQKEQPMINHRIRKAVLKGAEVMSVSSRGLDFNYEVSTQVVSDPASMITSLALIAKASFSLSKNKVPDHLADLLKSVRVNNAAKHIAKQLFDASKSTVLLGSISAQHPAYSTLRKLSAAIAENTNATLGYLSGSANTTGAWLSGALPHRIEAGESTTNSGMNATEMLHGSLKAYILLDVEPEYDCDNPSIAKKAMENADFVVAISPYADENVLSYANVILPSAAFGETSGTYVNIEGTWQSFRAAAKIFEDARPAWKILRVLGNNLNVKGFDYVSSLDVLNELRECCDKAENVDNNIEASGRCELIELNDDEIQRIGDVGEFNSDSLVRRAISLQKTTPQQNAIHLNSSEIERLGMLDILQNFGQVTVEQGNESTKMYIQVDDSIPDRCALLYSGTRSSSLLGSAFGTINITV